MKRFLALQSTTISVLWESLSIAWIVEGQGKVFAEVLIRRETWRYYIFAILCIAVDTIYYVKNASIYIMQGLLKWSSVLEQSETGTCAATIKCQVFSRGGYYLKIEKGQNSLWLWVLCGTSLPVLQTGRIPTKALYKVDRWTRSISRRREDMTRWDR